ncbi:MAG: hypothetical protein ACQEVD_05145 [Actinomycetota bacterium]
MRIDPGSSTQNHRRTVIGISRRQIAGEGTRRCSRGCHRGDLSGVRRPRTLSDRRREDHPLSDGNKRSAAALFVTFLDRNGALIDPDGNRRVDNNALAAMTLLVAMSEPSEKELMIALIIRMIVSERQ